MSVSSLLCLALGSLLLLSLPRLSHTQQQLQVEAVFNQSGVQGRMVFTQSGPESNTIINVSLTGLDSVQDMAPFPWHVHEYPFPLSVQQNPCGGATVGGHYDPLGASQVPNYPQVCSDDPSRCEIGDLSGRLGRLTASSDVVAYDDSVLSLYGIYSIIGRSIVVHFSDGARFVCANIGYPSDSGGRDSLLYVPFRDLFSGNIYFRQHVPNRPVASVYSDLVHSNMSTNTMGHNWHVHESPVRVGSDCMEAGPHYNPRGVDVSAPAYRYCSPTNQTQCEIGDLSNKGSPFDVNQGVVKQFYTDTDLPLTEGVTSEGFSIADRSVVIHAPDRAGPRIACANILHYTPLEAEAVFIAGTGSAIAGRIRFLQPSPFERTSVEVRLTGLGGGAGGYHVHVSPIGPESAGFPGRCSGAYAGGHWDPLGVSRRPGDTPAVTSDDYEVGDLSGKFGSLAGINEIDQTYFDPYIPLFGPLGIVGRSVVIHRNDGAGSRWACADIALTRPVVRVSYFVNTTSLVGRVTFIQPADDPFADTTVVVELEVVRELEPPVPTTSSIVVPGTSSVAMASSTPVMQTTSSVVQSSSSVAVTSPGATPSVGVASSLVMSTPVPSSSQRSVSSSSSMLQQAPPMTTTPPPPEVTSTPVPPSSTSAPGVSTTPIPPSSTPAPMLNTPVPSTSVPAPEMVTTPVSSPAEATTSAVPSVSSPVPEALTTSFMTSSSFAPGVTSTPVSLQSVPSSSSSQAPQVTPSPSTSIPPPPSTSTQDPSSSTLDIFFMAPSTTALPTLPSSSVGAPPTEAASPTPSPDVATPTEATSPSPLPAVPSPTPTSMARRRRSADSAPQRNRRQSSQEPPVQFEWSLRMGVASDPAQCGTLRVLRLTENTGGQCSTNNPLLCDAGDLTTKHGPLNIPRTPRLFRAVFTDPNLPLSGPTSPFSESNGGDMVSFLVQPRDGATGSEVVACDGAAQIVPPTMPPPPTTPPVTGMTTALPSSSNVGGIVGGIIAAIVAVVVVIVVVLLVVWLLRRKGRSKYDLSKASEMEMGTKKPKKPVLGVPNYKVLHHYEPQNEDDLALVPGEYVTLDETPYGGGWWKGTIEGKGTGWFPKTYVDYVDREAERKRRQDETFTLAAAAIMGASSSFSATTRRDTKSTPKKGATAKRAHTFSRGEIDSTPRMVSKFDKPYLEQDNVMVIENTVRDGSQCGGSRPETPASIRNNEIFANAQAVESGSSQEDQDIELIRAHFAELEQSNSSELPEDVLPHFEKHMAKFDFVGSTDIELDFKKGCVIKVIEKSDNGWWKGVYMGQAGWFPESYIDPTPLAGPVRVSGGGGGGEGERRERAESASSAADVERPKNMDEMMANVGGDLEALEYHALFSFHSETEGDLSFQEGDTVLVYWGQDNGWWFGSAGGQQGWFPESYVQPVLDTSYVEAPAADEATIEATPLGGKSADSSSHVEVAGDTSVKQSAERAPSADSQDSGVGQEEVKEDVVKTGDIVPPGAGGLQSELANALQKKKRKSLPAVQQPLSAGTSDSTSDSTTTTSKPSESTITTSTPSEVKTAEGKTAEVEDSVFDDTTPAKQKPPPPKRDKTKEPKMRRQSAPAKAVRRLAPPPPAAGSSPKITPKPSPEPSRTSQLAETTSDTPKSKEPVSDKDKQDATPSAEKTPLPAVAPPTAPETSSATKQRARPKRRTTAIDNRAKPRRRPPPPVPPALLTATAATAETTPTTKTAEPARAKKAPDVRKDTKVDTPVSTPVPPPRAKARMKKVKRPASRMIPPPPSIPLPPPPPSKASVSPLTTTTKANNSATTPAAAATVQTPTSPAGLEGKPGGAGPPKVARPPPPKRISSLLPETALPSKAPRKKSKKEGTTDDEKPAKSRPDSKVSPPKRPPPPRPTSAISSTMPKTEAPTRPPPPVASGDLREEPEETGESIKPRGSKLMGSLRRMVKRDSKKEKVSSGPGEDTSDKPKRPAHPPRKASSTKQAATKPLLDSEGESSPVPKAKPRSRKKSSVSSPPVGDVVTTKASTTAAEVGKVESNPPITPTSPSKAPQDASKQRTPPPQGKEQTPPAQNAQPPTQPPLQSKQQPPAQSKQQPPAQSSQPTKPQPPAQTDRRKSSTIPAKPPPPVTVSGGAKPKPPLAPKPSLSPTPSPSATSPPTMKPQSPLSPGTPANFYRAVKSYEGKSGDELSFSKGDTVMFMEKREGGYYYGMLDSGKAGLFPVDSVEPFLK